MGINNRYNQADELINHALVAIRVDATAASAYARLFLAPDASVAPAVFAAALRSRLADAVTALVRGGWLPSTWPSGFDGRAMKHSTPCWRHCLRRRQRDIRPSGSPHAGGPTSPVSAPVQHPTLPGCPV